MISYKKRKYRLFLALLTVVITLFWVLYARTKNQYYSEINKLRKQYNHYIKYYEDSPLEQDDISNFNSLEYFKIDERCKVKAKLTPLEKNDTFNIKLTPEKHIRFIKYGILSFQLNGEKHELTLLKHPKSTNNKFFLPFKDKTNGHLTYGSGRYLDVIYEGKNPVIVDFNLAYNPYCAYNTNYKCAMVPKENRLNIEIKAGEKAFSLINETDN